ncbi:PTS sugar transporter subunit IIA [Psychromonas sp. KJ10-10]|uniref:PTS sugar transporter subunit IIA n=1 Tax=Psychromonas sp. KJ10-10 TaxID=3391823 RepID=UPI0039B6896A
MSKLAQFFTRPLSQVVEKALMKREDLSSTAVGNELAIPHVMLSDISQPSIIVLRLNRALNWHSNLGDVKMIIAILIPSPAPPEMIKSITKLTRSLIDSYNCKLIAANTDAEAIKAILFHLMSRKLPG